MVNLLGMVQLGASTAAFLFGAMMAKQWALAPSMAKIVITLALYTLGNLIMLKLIRDFGLSISLSLSAVIQLVAVNAVALAFYGEKLTTLQAVGVMLAIAAVALVTLGPYFEGR